MSALGRPWTELDDSGLGFFSESFTTVYATALPASQTVGDEHPPRHVRRKLCGDSANAITSKCCSESPAEGP